MDQFRKVEGHEIMWGHCKWHRKHQWSSTAPLKQCLYNVLHLIKNTRQD